MTEAPDAPFPWLKLWHSFLDSPKIQRVTEALRARYVNLLCLACKTDRHGKLPPIEHIAFMIRLTEEETQKTLDSLIEAGLIEHRAKAYWIHDWDHWQYKKSRHAQKQKRYRDKMRASGNVNGNALPARYVTESIALPRAREEKDKEKDKEKEPPKSPSGGKVSRSTFEPPDWVPRADWDGYIESRKANRRKPTPYALGLLVSKLDRARAKGHDIALMLQDAAIGGWSSVFEPGESHAKRNGEPPKPSQEPDMPILSANKPWSPPPERKATK